MLSALRHIVRKCSASQDPRLACLTDVKQLDRIPPGSRAEAFGGVIVPRFRGDVHSDLTALVTRATFAAGGSSPAKSRGGGPFSTAMARLRPVSSESSLVNATGSLRRQGSKGARLESAGPPLCRILDSFRSRHGHAASADGLAALLRRNTAVPAGGEAQSLSPLRPASHARTASADSAAVERAASASPAALRWHAVRVYVRALAGEARLRQRLWRGALEAARASSPAPRPGAPTPARSAPTSGMQSPLRRLEVTSGARKSDSSAASFSASANDTEPASSTPATTANPSSSGALASRDSEDVVLESGRSMMQLRMPSLVPAELDAQGASEPAARIVGDSAWTKRASPAALAC